MNISKLLVLPVLLFISMYSLNAQTDSAAIIKFSERIPADLELELKVKETYAIGYAYCFSGTVQKVNRGIIQDSIILLTVIAGDEENYKTLTSGNENTVYRMYFMHNKDNEEYSTSYVTGFVDSKMTSWKIIGIQKVH